MAQPKQSDAAPQRLLTMLFLLGIALLVFGSKLWLIKDFGNITPFWDQWDGEGGGLYDALLRHGWTAPNWFAPHNEHRIFTTRLLSALILVVNNGWDPKLQMEVNALIHVLAISMLVWFSTDGAFWEARWLMLIAGVTTIVPFAVENTLGGFQSAFYFLLFFSFIALRVLVSSPALSPKWWLGLGAAALSYLSLASGALTVLAAAAAIGLRFSVTRPRLHKDQLAIALLSCLFVAMLVATPAIERHAALHAHSLWELVNGFVINAGWPIRLGELWNGFVINAARPLNLASIFGALTMSFFPVALTFVLVKNRLGGSTDWFLVAVWLFVLGNCLAISYERNAAMTASRYFDLLALNVIVSGACIQRLIPYTAAWRRKALWIGAVVWAVAVVAGVVSNGLERLPGLLEHKRIFGQQEELNVRNFLATNDERWLRGKPQFAIPYPDANRLAALLRRDTIRSILPAELVPANAGKARLETLRGWLLNNWLLFFAVGAGIILGFGLYCPMLSARPYGIRISPDSESTRDIDGVVLTSTD